MTIFSNSSWIAQPVYLRDPHSLGNTVSPVDSNTGITFRKVHRIALMFSPTWSRIFTSSLPREKNRIYFTSNKTNTIVNMTIFTKMGRTDNDYIKNEYLAPPQVHVQDTTIVQKSQEADLGISTV